MVLAVMILGVLAIGVLAPRWIVARMPSGLGIGLGIIAALSLGAGFVYIAAQGAEALGLEAAKPAFDRGFNAWKIMLLLAPAVALHTRRQMKEG